MRWRRRTTIETSLSEWAAIRKVIQNGVRETIDDFLEADFREPEGQLSGYRARVDCF